MGFTGCWWVLQGARREGGIFGGMRSVLGEVLSYFVGALLTSRTAPSVRLQLLQTMCRGQGLQGISG